MNEEIKMNKILAQHRSKPISATALCFLVVLCVGCGGGGHTVASITVTPGSSSLSSGAMQQFTAMGNYSDGSHQDLTTSATWSSSNSAVATVNASGLATGVAAGTATITAAVGSVNGHSTLTVVGTLASITVTPSSSSVSSGAMQQFTAMGNFSDGSHQDLTPSATWSSSNSAVATVNASGLATGVAVGIATITAAVGSVNGHSTLTVVATLASITVTPSSSSLGLGAMQQFTAMGNFSDGSHQDLTTSATWSSSNSAVATVNASGLATGAAAGTATITAAAGSVNGHSTLTVVPRFAYVVNGTSSDISAFTINDSTGALTLLGSPVETAGIFPDSVIVDPMERFVYVANLHSQNVSTFSINATGALTLSGSLVRTDGPAVSVTVVPTGKFLYVANSKPSNNLSTFSIDASTGALTAVSRPVPSGGVDPQAVTVDPTGKFLYVVNKGIHSLPDFDDSKVSAFTINPSSGELTLVGSVSLGSPFYESSSVIVEPAGKFLYVANSGSGFNSVSAFTIDQSTGALTPVDAAVPTGGINPVSVTVDPMGRFLYVANFVSQNVSTFAINATGALALLGSPVATGDTPPVSVTVESTGRFVYAANYASDGTVSILSINADTGALTLLGPPVMTGGHFAYAIVTTRRTP
jgi:6-phosphogluconolactonase (cycloisomerase 2 family)